MVGGFSECELVQDAIRDKIGTSMKLIIPVEAGLAVLKGAVLFGLQPIRIVLKSDNFGLSNNFPISLIKLSMVGLNRSRKASGEM
jgi:hypothetical protein